MPLMTPNEPTPCAAMFDTLKRFGGISHKDLAVLVLSERPLADGRTPGEPLDGPHLALALHRSRPRGLAAAALFP